MFPLGNSKFCVHKPIAPAIGPATIYLHMTPLGNMSAILTACERHPELAFIKSLTNYVGVKGWRICRPGLHCSYKAKAVKYGMGHLKTLDIQLVVNQCQHWILSLAFILLPFSPVIVSELLNGKN
jgi:hypothetical protein